MTRDDGLNQENGSGASDKWSNSGYNWSRFTDKKEAGVRQRSRGWHQVIERMIDTNVKNWPPFDHMIPLLEIYPKKTDMQKDSKKLSTFLFTIAKIWK